MNSARLAAIWQRFVSCCALASALSSLAGRLAADQPQSSPGSAPTITFSEDETTVRLDSAAGSRSFRRPLTFCWEFTATGTTRWVAPTGDDAADGSTAKPLRTIARALDLAGPGDVIYVRAGTYVESLVIGKSGREGLPLVLSCAPGELGRVKITPPAEYVRQNPSGAVIRLHTAQHVWINGLVVEGPLGRPEAPPAETYGANGITFAGRAGLGCRVSNCVVYGNVHCGIKEMGHGGTGILLAANVIFNNGTRSTDHGIYCPADELTIEGNVIFDNAGFGIHSYSHPRRQLISRNVCLGNKVAGIILAGSENRVFYNVCAYNGIGMFYFRSGCTGNIVKNNIFAFNHSDCGWDNAGGKDTGPANNEDDHNCYYPGQPSPQIGAGQHELLADPRFVDSRHGDFRLQADSPCRAKATAVFDQQNAAPGDLGAFRE